ncbi:MAG: type I glyceraldehyde-3-phosphate dehydrogenase [Tissierellia bacterium]|nr:type I glyceraldehyde-3-phosphate dehydrogenase [Tissierellia bacterium]
MKVGVSGFGRIGRNFVRQYFEDGVKDFDLVAINASGDMETLRMLFQYDSTYREFKGTVETYEEGLVINGKKVRVTGFRDPAEIPWKEMGVEIVVDSTGAFREKKDLQKHIDGGAKKVILTAPGKDEDASFVVGVNEKDYDPSKHHIISNASCTTNCLAPVAKVVLEEFGIERGLMTTVHAYTNDQMILDKRHKDMRRARTAGQNIIPTTTGAAKAVANVIPELKGKLNGYALRVPVVTVSIVDVVFETQKDVTAESVNAALKKASEGELKGILGFETDPLVSSDYIGDDRSSIVDAGLTMAMGDRMVKVVAWYDNEWGYSQRVIDLVSLVSKKG